MYFLKHCSISGPAQQGNTALHLAAAGNHREVALILVENEIEMDLPNYVSLTRSDTQQVIYNVDGLFSGRDKTM